MTTWINIDQLLSKFGLSRNDLLENLSKVSLAVDAFSRRLPTYVTIKDVKKRWGKGQVSIMFSVMLWDLCLLIARYKCPVPKLFIYFFWKEDVYPVAQYEKLWGDMSSVEGMECSYFVVSRQRGQQLKDPAQREFVW